MRNHFLLLMLGLCLGLTAWAQPVSKSANFGISSPQLIDEMLMVVPGVGSKSRDLLNAQSVKEHLMPVRNINRTGSDLAYALTTCLEFYTNLDKNYKVNLSPDYITLNLSSQGKQLQVGDAMEVLSKDGTVSAAILPFGARQLTSGVYATEKFKISNYLHLFRSQTRGKQKVFEAKKALMRGNPVLIEVKASEQFPYIQETKILEGFQPGEESFYLVVVGYDEKMEAFELRNSQGAKWGMNGYLWVSYDDFGNAVENAYVILP